MAIVCCKSGSGLQLAVDKFEGRASNSGLYSEPDARHQAFGNGFREFRYTAETGLSRS